MGNQYFPNQGMGQRTKGFCQHHVEQVIQRTWFEDPFLRPSHHLKPGRPKVIVKPNIQVGNFRNLQPGVPIFVQNSSGSGIRTVIPTQVQVPRNVTTQEWALNELKWAI